MKKWVLRIILVVIAVVLLVGTLSACGDEWAGFVEVENLQDMTVALGTPVSDLSLPEKAKVTLSDETKTKSYI